MLLKFPDKMIFVDKWQLKEGVEPKQNEGEDHLMWLPFPLLYFEPNHLDMTLHRYL